MARRTAVSNRGRGGDDEPRSRRHHGDAFVGYLVAGFWGSLVSTIGIFLPSFIFILIAAPLLARHGKNPNVQGFVRGAYGAAIGQSSALASCLAGLPLATG